MLNSTQNYNKSVFEKKENETSEYWLKVNAKFVKDCWGLRNVELVLHLPRYMIGLKNPRLFFIQSEVKPQPIMTRPQSFSRASR